MKIKLFLSLIILSSLNLHCSEFKDNKEDRQRLSRLLREKGVSLDHLQLEVEKGSMNPLVWAGWVKPRIERLPLPNADVYRYIIRGMLIGFSHGMIDSIENILHNSSYYAAGKIGRLGANTGIATVLKTALPLMISNVLYITNPKSFRGRGTLLTLCEYDGYFGKILNQKQDEYEKYKNIILEKSPVQVKSIVASGIQFLNTNETSICSYAEEYFGSELPSVHKIFNYLIRGSDYNLNQVAQKIQANPFDIINNQAYKLYQAGTNTLVDFSMPAIDSIFGPGGQILLQYVIENNVKINLQSKKEGITNLINDNFKKDGYERLEEALDPVFISLGKSYAQNLAACLASPFLDKKNIDPYSFVTKKEKLGPIIKKTLDVGYYTFVYVPVNVVKGMSWIFSKTSDKKIKVVSVNQNEHDYNRQSISKSFKQEYEQTLLHSTFKGFNRFFYYVYYPIFRPIELVSEGVIYAAIEIWPTFTKPREYFQGIKYLEDKKYGSAFECFFQAATKKNDADSQYIVAQMYLNGIGTNLDKDKGLDFLYKAKSQNHREASWIIFTEQFENRFKNTKELFHSRKRKLDRFKRKLNSQFSHVLQSLPIIYNLTKSSTGVFWYYDQALKYVTEKNYKEAIKFFEIASDLNVIEAQYILGLYYKYGTGGVKKDISKASELLKKAADKGHKEAKEELYKIN